MPRVDIGGSVTRFVRSGAFQDIHYNRGGSFEVGFTDHYMQGLIKFPDRVETGKLPSGANVTQAHLHVFCEARYTNRNRYESQPLLDAWNEDYVTWNTRPTQGRPFGQFTFNALENSWSAIDVIQTLKEAVSDVSYLRTGFRLRNDALDPIHATFSGGTSTRAPYIRVLYDALPPSSLNVVSGANSVYMSGRGVGGAQGVRIRTSDSGGSPLSFVGFAAIDGDNYSYTDVFNAPRPSPSGFSSASTSSNNVDLSWAAFSQDSATRYYIARRELSDGTVSQDVGPFAGTVHPILDTFQLQRKGLDGNFLTIYEGKNTSYRDSGLPTGRVYEYRVRSKNSQGSWSDFSNTSVTLEKPPAPVFNSLVIEDNYYYVASLGGVPSGADINVYTSSDDSSFGRVSSTVTPVEGGYEVRHQPSAGRPVIPVFDAPSEYENRIALSWSTPSTPAIVRYIRLSYTLDGVESESTESKRGVIEPYINVNALRRKPRDNPNSYYSQIYSGPSPSHTDLTVSVGEEYTYEVVATNNHGQSSPPATVDAQTGVPVAPTIGSFTESGTVRLSGTARNGAESIIVYREAGGVYTSLGEASFSGLLAGEEWVFEHTPQLSQPPQVRWSDARVDTSGSHLSYRPPVNPATQINYAAARVVGGTEGSKGEAAAVTISPRIESYRIRRRKTPRTGEESNPEFVWRVIANTVSTDFTDADVDFSSSYDYQVLAYNDYGLYSVYSQTRTLETQSPPPPPPDPSEFADPPSITHYGPQANVEVSDQSSRLRFAWGYQDALGYDQRSYRLEVESPTATSYWNGSSWVAGQSNVEPSDVETSLKRADVDASLFENGKTYTITLSVLSHSGLRSAEATWTIVPLVLVTTSFDLVREVKRNITSSYDLLRDVRSYSDKESYSVRLSWNVQEPLSFEVDDGLWEGGGNTWVHTVFDRDGRPEPYGEIDLERGLERYTFTGDSRGRFQLKVPDDIAPGIYTMRERGPSMAPRTTRNIVIKDDWLIYAHGHRHTSDGPDPIFGITSKQISPEANISPDQISGGQSLGEIVDEYGNRIKEGLERHVSSGHGNFVVSGFGHSLNGNDIAVQSGVCWVNNQRQEAASTSQTLTDGTYKVYVESSQIMIALRSFYPVGTCPLYTLNVTGATVQVTDDRLYHPPFEPVNTRNVAVKWGPEYSSEIDHEGVSLSDYLSKQINILQERLDKEEELRNAFLDENRRIENLIKEEATRRHTARETGLQVSYASGSRYLYSMFRTEEKGALPPTAGISDFSTTENLSSLTDLRIKDNVATLPENWLTGFEYTLRTLRIPCPPSYMLQFTLLYEPTGASFEAWGSLSNDGFYLPKRMGLYRTLTDQVRIERVVSEKQINLNTLDRRVDSRLYDLRADTYRADFNEAGTEAVIEVLVKGGTTDDGVRLHGFLVNSI